MVATVLAASIASRPNIPATGETAPNHTKRPRTLSIAACARPSGAVRRVRAPSDRCLCRTVGGRSPRTLDIVYEVDYSIISP